MLANWKEKRDSSIRFESILTLETVQLRKLESIKEVINGGRHIENEKFIVSGNSVGKGSPKENEAEIRLAARHLPRNCHFPQGRATQSSLTSIDPFSAVSTNTSSSHNCLKLTSTRSVCWCISFCDLISGSMITMPIFEEDIMRGVP